MTELADMKLGFRPAYRRRANYNEDERMSVVSAV